MDTIASYGPAAPAPNPTPDPATPPSRSRPVWPLIMMLVGVVVVAVTVGGFLLGYAAHDTSPGTCTGWPSCGSSAAQEWANRSADLLYWGVVNGAVVGWFGFVWFMLIDRRTARRVTAFIVMVLAGLMAVAFGLLAVAVAGTTCGPQDFLCFGGPEAAAVVGTPAVAAVLLIIGLMVGIRLGERPAGRRLVTGLLAVSTSGVVVVAGLFMAASIVSSLTY